MVTSRGTTSVVIATYNRAKLLLELLDDLAHQEGMSEGFDVTVVDDGSLQPIEPLLRERNWPFALQVIEQHNTGQARARHAGILASRGDLIVIVDDDMRVAPDFLASHHGLHTRGFEVVLGLIRAPDNLSAKPLFERFHAAQLALFLADMRAGKPIPGAALCTGNVSFRRARYLEVGGFDLSLQRSEDRDLGIRFKKAGARFAFSEHASVTHRSDHTQLEVWLRRAFLYGVYDSRISNKHPDDGYNDPWHYLLLMNPLARPLLLGAVVAPRAGAAVSAVALRMADAIDRLGMERLALKGVTLAYGLNYYRGVRSEHPSLFSAARSLATFFTKPNAFDHVNDGS
ncbi:MAG TPA: glycosyltransferase [Polyangiales bacterium]|nr:glycosyltransferase [Polyangiales bacterium]